MSVMQDFRAFVLRGNVIDLAVGVIIGAAFGRIVDSMVKDLIMPLANFLVGGHVNFTNKFLILKMPPDYQGPLTYEALHKAGANLFAWGNALTILIDFILLAFIIFWMVRLFNRAKTKFSHEESKQAAANPPPPAEEVVLLREIRDALKTSVPRA